MNTHSRQCTTDPRSGGIGLGPPKFLLEPFGIGLVRRQWLSSAVPATLVATWVPVKRRCNERRL